MHCQVMRALKFSGSLKHLDRVVFGNPAFHPSSLLLAAACYPPAHVQHRKLKRLHEQLNSILHGNANRGPACGQVFSRKSLRSYVGCFSGPMSIWLCPCTPPGFPPLLNSMSTSHCNCPITHRQLELPVLHCPRNFSSKVSGS